MARYRSEPPHTHGDTPSTAVLVVNLGTPAAPTTSAVRSYLREFLSDPRVVEIPRILWWPLLNGVILNLRPKASAAKYALVWEDEGSPLAVHTEKQAQHLAERLRHDGHEGIVVDWAMRYGNPSIPDALERLKARGCTRIVILPLYPQYAASTTASVIDEVGRNLKHYRNQPEIRFVRSFPDHPGYIGALAQSVREHWQAHGEPERLVMSYHGIPRRSLDLGDPYYCECHKTSRLLAEALGLPRERWEMTFQSRFGKTEWLQPYTEPTLREMASNGVKSVDVICPGFVSDCLETLEEIAMECREAFLTSGGKEFRYIPCLNERTEWITALSALCTAHLGNWLTDPQPSSMEREQSASLARAHGAQR